MDIPFGSRFVGIWGKDYGDQLKVSSIEEIKNLIERHLSLDNIGISISTYKDGIPFLLFLPFDFDSSNLKKTWDEALNLFNFFKNNNYRVYLTFSGKKGFHVLVSTKPKMYTKKQLRQTQKMFKTLFNLDTLDEQIFGDIRRIMRIPYTYNINGNLCEIISYSNGEQLDLDTIYKDEYIPTYNGNGNGNGNSYHDYPCIESIVRTDSEPRHIIRFNYVVLRLSEGWSYDEILDEIESFGWLDFDPEYTLRQIEHIDGKGYVPMGCKNLKDLGYCVVADCEEDKSLKDYLNELGIL